MRPQAPAPDTLLHIGFPKALSSWLQQCYFLEPSGYRQVLDAFKLQLMLVAPDENTFDEKLSRSEIDAAVNNAREDGLRPVISSEALCGDLVRGGYNTPRNAGRLRAMLGPTTRVLLIVREQRQLIRSAYKTLVFFGEERPLERLLCPAAESDNPRFNTDFLQFDRLVELYRDTFSPSSVLVLPYEMFQQRPQDFLEAINQHAQLPPLTEHAYSQLPLSRKINSNESLTYIEIQRYLNRLAGTSSRNYAGRFGGNTFEKILKRIAWHKKHASPTRLDSRLEKKFSDKVQRLTDGVFSHSNHRLQELTGLPLEQYGYQ